MTGWGVWDDECLGVQSLVSGQSARDVRMRRKDFGRLRWAGTTPWNALGRRCHWSFDASSDDVEAQPSLISFTSRVSRLGGRLNKTFGGRKAGTRSRPDPRAKDQRRKV